MLRAPSHAVADATRDHLISAYGAKSADLLLIDYRISVGRTDGLADDAVAVRVDRRGR